MLFDTEHYKLLHMFEADKTFKRSRRFEKEPKNMWPKGIIYCDGITNELFLAYRNGYVFGKTVESER